MRSIQVISSMATRPLLEDRARAFEASSGARLTLQSVGGVDALRRVTQGEAFDVVVLAAESIERLAAAERLLPGSRVDWVRSRVVVAVRRGTPHPDISSEAALRRAVEACRTGYSTGPSGVALSALFSRWGIEPSRLFRAPPGVPVGGMVARGEVDLGFQQASEMMGIEGVEVLGPLPSELRIVTTFSAAICRTASDTEPARRFIASLVDPAAAEAIRSHGMEPP